MLEGLKRVKWRKLRHAYGRATDVPRLLRDLASSDPGKRDTAIRGLYSNLWHQGTVYEATSHAVPFLIELAAENSVEDRPRILVLLAHLATSHSYYDVHGNLPGFAGRYDEEQLSQIIEEDLSWVRAAREAVAQGIDLYLSFLRDETPQTRAASAYLLGAFDDHANRILPALRGICECETDTRAKASALLAIGTLAQSESHLSYLRRFLSGTESGLVRLCASLALARTSKEETSAEAIDVLIQAAIDPAPVRKEYAALPWADAGVVCDVGRHLAVAGDRAAAAAVPALADALRRGDGAVDAAAAMLDLAFGRTLPGHEVQAQQLTPLRREALDAIAGSRSAWFLNASMSRVLRAFGLPDTRDGLREFLGMANR